MCVGGVWSVWHAVRQSAAFLSPFSFFLSAMSATFDYCYYNFCDISFIYLFFFINFEFIQSYIMDEKTETQSP